jgi:hypothetical protein
LTEGFYFVRRLTRIDHRDQDIFGSEFGKTVKVKVHEYGIKASNSGSRTIGVLIAYMDTVGGFRMKVVETMDALASILHSPTAQAGWPETLPWCCSG